MKVPSLDPAWLQSEHNADVARGNVFVGGRVSGGILGQPVKGAQVVFHRPDRTWAQILALDREIVQIRQHRRVRDRLDEGAAEADVARDLGLPLETVRKLAATPIDPAAWSGDARLADLGEFFFRVALLEDDGFFFGAVPRQKPFRLAARAPGHRDLDESREAGTGFYEDLGRVPLTAPLRLPDPSKPWAPAPSWPWEPTPPWRQWLPAPAGGAPAR